MEERCSEASAVVYIALTGLGPSCCTSAIMGAAVFLLFYLLAIHVLAFTCANVFKCVPECSLHVD